MKNSHKKSDMFPSIMRETSFTDHLFACLSIARLAAFIIHLFVSSDNPLIRIFFIVLPGGGTVTYTYDNDYRVISETHEEKMVISATGYAILMTMRGISHHRPTRRGTPRHSR